MFHKLKQFNDLRKQAKTFKNELSQILVEERQGSFKIEMDGNQEVKKIEVDAAYINSEKKKALEEALVSLFNGAIKKVQRKMAERMMKDGSLKDFSFPGFNKK